MLSLITNVVCTQVQNRPEDCSFFITHIISHHTPAEPTKLILFHANDCINSTWWMPKRVFESRSLNCSLFGRVAYGGEYYGRAAGSLAPGAEVSGSEPAELAPQSSIRIRILHTIFVQRDREFKDRTQGLGVVLVKELLTAQ